MKRKKPLGPDLFEWGEGQRAQDEGFEQVLENTPEHFKYRLSMAFWFLVESGQEFTAEDARPFSGDPPNHPNAYGAVWSGLVNRAFKEGYLETVGITRADRTRSHACLLPIYRGIGRNGV